MPTLLLYYTVLQLCCTYYNCTVLLQKQYETGITIAKSNKNTNKLSKKIVKVPFPDRIWPKEEERMVEQSYNKVPLLIRNYFKLRCGTYGPGNYQDYTEERSEDSWGYPVFRITVKSIEAHKVMQRILSEENGIE